MHRRLSVGEEQIGRKHYKSDDQDRQRRLKRGRLATNPDPESIALERRTGGGGVHNFSIARGNFTGGAGREIRNGG